MNFKRLLKRLHHTDAHREPLPNGNQRAPRPAWDTLYHRGVIDEQLADGVMERFEVVFSNLHDDKNWAVALYLLYSPEDRNSFNSWNVRLELKKLGLVVLRNALKGDLKSAGVQQAMLTDWGFALTLDEPERPFRCRLRKSAPGSTAQDWFSVDADIFLCEEASDLTAQGRFTTLTRVLPVVGDREEVYGKLVCEGNVAIAPHMDLSQRGVRGRDSHLYLTEGANRILIGPHPGCDLLADSLTSACWITFDPHRGGITADSGMKVKGDSVEGLDFTLRYLPNNISDGHESSKFGSIIQRRLKQSDFVLKVIARVLPRGNGDGKGGYGSDWCGLSTAARRIVVSLRLAANMSIVADEKGIVSLEDEGKGTSLELEDGQTIGGTQYTWQVDPTGTFYGFLIFEESSEDKQRKRTRRIPADETMDGVVAGTGVIATGKVPLLTEYRDDELLSRRGSILVRSNGRGSFDIAVASTSALRTLFTLQGQEWHCRHTRDETDSVKLEAPCKFTFGSSVFSLAPNGKAYDLQTHWSGLYQSIHIAELS